MRKSLMGDKYKLFLKRPRQMEKSIKAGCH